MIYHNQMDRLLNNKVKLSISKFRKITATLRAKGIYFGYEIIFKDKYYYPLYTNFDLIKDFVQTVKYGSIPYGRDTTGHCDHDYSFTAWSESQHNESTKVYLKHGLGHGMTISKDYGEYVVLYHFMYEISNNKQDELINDKEMLVKFIHKFESLKASLLIPTTCVVSQLFCYEQGFDSSRVTSPVYEDESAKNIVHYIKSGGAELNISGKIIKITPKERTICSLLKKVPFLKAIARILEISINTVKTHLRHVQAKLGVHSKIELLRACEAYHITYEYQL